MKKTRFGLLLLLSCTATLNMAAQTVSHKVEWKGLETWYADTSSVSVITADHAAYLRSDRLPSIVNIQPIGQLEPVVTIMNTQYEAVPENEACLIDHDVLGAEAFVETHVFITDEGNKLQTAVFPFALQDGRIMRLTNYQLQTSIPPKAKVIRATGTHTYADQSVLATGNFVKLRIDSTGLYRISYTTLRAAGIDPANVRVFGYGGAMLSQDFLQKKTDDLPEIAVYDDGSNIIFYAQGTTSWSYNSTTGLFEHTINPYATSGYYFVTSSDVGQKKRITNAAAIPTTEGTYSVSRFTDYSVYEREAVNLVDPSGLAGGGRQFMGDRMTSGTSITIPFHFDNVYTSQSVKAVMNVATSTQQTASFALAFAGNSRILNISKSTTMTDQAYTRSITSSFKAQKDIDEFRLTFTASEASTIGYLDYLEVNACRSLIMSGSNMPFRSIDNYGDSMPYLFSLSNAGGNVEVWEITEPTEMKRMQVTHSGETLSFAGLNGDTVHQYVAVDLTRINELPEPQVVGGIPNQNLHGLSGIDLVIITHPDFKAASDRLAQAHADMDGMTTAVVTSEEVYNEFSSGTPDATAYRWLMKMLYDRAKDGNGTAPRYLLLMGDGTFDNRKLLPSSGTPFLLTYQAVNSFSEPSAYATDDYFGYLDDNEGVKDVEGLMDIGVGRLPVSSETMADNVVQKIIRYMNDESHGLWKNQITFLADDGDTELMHTVQADSVTKQLSPHIPAYVLNKIYLEAYQQEVSSAGESYPLAKNRLDNLLNNGTLYFNYTGHGSALNISNEAMITQSSIQRMTNTNYALWMLATCSFSHFDRNASSSGEDAVTNPNGGAIGVVSACRTVYANPNRNLNIHFSNNLFTRGADGTYPRIGDALANAKNSVRLSDRTNSDGVNRLAYLLLGDPALQLHYPSTYSVATDSINGRAVDGNDTIRAMQIVRLSGHVTNSDGTDADDFNGYVYVTVFDKETVVQCLDNDNKLSDKSKAYKFRDRQSTIFRGNTEARNGRFSVTFMLPKDIKYNYGTGLINYYVTDTITHLDGQGVYTDFYIGGGDTTIVLEEDGPEVDIYLNSTAFKSGGKVNESPTFLAYMYDEHGINTAGSGIGHDLLLMVDNDPEQCYILNEYFNATNSYKGGSVSYKMSDLEEGKHTLMFRSWDLLNNSTTRHLDFEVVKGLKPSLIRVVCYPNPAPASSTVTFDIEHDRPNTVMQAEVNVFDLNGRRVWSHSQNTADRITWDLSQTGCQAGVYIYQIRVRSLNSDYTSNANKIILLGQ